MPAMASSWGLTFCGTPGHAAGTLLNSREAPYVSMRMHAGDKVSCDQIDPQLAERLDKLIGPPRQWREKFTHGLSFGGRVGAVCALACAARPFLPEDTPSIYIAYMPALIPAIVYTLYGDLATTMMYAVQGLLGTGLACANHLLIDHLSLSDSKVTSVVDFVIFTVVVLALNMNLNVKIFALSWTPYFVMTHAKPDADLVEGELTAVMLSQVAGSLLALLATLLPWPKTAFGDARRLAATTAKETAELFLFLAKYYCGSEPHLDIHMWNSHLEAQRNLASRMKVATNAAWWEGFDLGGWGQTRALLGRHVLLLEQMDRRLGVLKVCAQREEFSASHQKAMVPVRAIVADLVCAMGELLMDATLCAADGRINEAEKQTMQQRIGDVHKLVKELSEAWGNVRKTLAHGVGLARDVRTEGFFICEVSRVADMVVEFAEELHVFQPKDNMCKVACGSLRNWFNMEVITSPANLNFVLRNGLSLIISFLLGLFVWDFNHVAAGYLALMLSQKPGAALHSNLGRMQGTILGVLVGNVLFTNLVALHSPDVVFYCQCVALFLFECFANFIYHSSEDFGNIGGLLAVFGGKVLLRVLTTTRTLESKDILTMEGAAYEEFFYLVVGLALLTSLDMLLLQKPASCMAREALLTGMTKTLNLFEAFLVDGESQLEDMDKTLNGVEGNLASASGFASEANNEPRWHKALFRKTLFDILIEQVDGLHMDIRTVLHAFSGVHNHGLYRLVSSQPAFQVWRTKFLKRVHTLQDLVRKVLEHESVLKLDVEVIQEVRSSTPLQGELESLVAEVIAELQAEANASPKKDAREQPTSMAADRVCRLCTAFEMLDRVDRDISAMLASSLQRI
mmetsp:Transcript_110753/g.352821  ORF Transcript_110753/g.352821 Transcript_110753/m.352821 type:complete len:853 (-) Transcript_110753:23-2581(-)